MYEIFGYPYGNPDAELLIYQPGNTNALVLAPKLTREVSKGGSLTFTMPRDHPQYEMLQKMSTVVSVHRDGKEIWRGRILNHESDWYNRRAVYCEGNLSYFNDSCVTPFSYEGNLKEFLSHLIEAHNSMCADTMKRFELGTVTAALGDKKVLFGDADKYGVGEDYGSTWEILDKMVLKTFGGYFYCSFNTETGNNVLNYCDQAYEALRQTAQNIEYGVNLLNLTEKTDTNSLFTRIYPIGNKHTVKKTAWYYKLMWWRDHSKDYDEDHEERYGIMGTDSATIKKYLPAAGYSYNLEEGYIQNEEAAKKFGIVAKIRELDTDSANDTFAAGVQDLQQNHAMVTSYTIKAVDLVDAGYDTERLDFAVYSHIISEPHSVDAIMLCTKLVEPLERPDQKEFTFGMTRRTLTDRQVANLGKTNALDENSVSSASYNQQLIKHLTQTDKNVEEAAKTATNFLEFTPENGLIVRHEQLPNKKVQITNDGIKVLSGSSMVNITSDSISITDGNGSCSINSGAITFHGIRNQVPILTPGTWDATTIEYDFSPYSAVMICFESNKGSTWFASGGGAGRASVVIPVNGKWYSMIYPWNTTHRRDVCVSQKKIQFGTGKERTSGYTPGGTILGLGPFLTSFSLESPTSDGWTDNRAVCVPYEVYGFM